MLSLAALAAAWAPPFEAFAAGEAAVTAHRTGAAAEAEALVGGVAGAVGGDGSAKEGDEGDEAEDYEDEEDDDEDQQLSSNSRSRPSSSSPPSDTSYFVNFKLRVISWADCSHTPTFVWPFF